MAAALSVQARLLEAARWHAHDAYNSTLYETGPSDEPSRIAQIPEWMSDKTVGEFYSFAQSMLASFRAIGGAQNSAERQLQQQLEIWIRGFPTDGLPLADWPED